MKRFRIPALISAVCAAAALAGCGEHKQPAVVFIRNLTNQTIQEVYLHQEKDTENKNDNIIEEDFPHGMNIRYDLGSYTEEQYKEGFSLRVVSNENFDESFGKLQLADNDTIVLYFDKTRLSLALNKTDIEIKALQAKSEEENRDLPDIN